MIRRIELDYAARRSRAGPVLLGIGMFATAATMVVHASLSRNVEQWEAAAASQRPAAQGASSREDAVNREHLESRIAQANEAIGNLSLPWSGLFTGVEGAATDAVALLSIQPQPQQHLVTLNGEARTYSDLLEYLGKLDASHSLSHARLLSHRVRKEDPHHPVSFAIAATWEAIP